MSNRDESFVTTTLRISAGAIVWALHFAVIYGYTGLACARRFHDTGAMWVSALPWVIGGSTVIAAAATVPFLVPALRGGALGFNEWMSAGIAALAIVAIVLEGLTFLWLPACM